MAVFSTNTPTAPIGSRTGVITDAINSVFARFEAWHSYRKTVIALAALSDRELNDIGITRSEIKFVARNCR
jgi:uncharacterized protein YjiS (DUF1127 family)